MGSDRGIVEVEFESLKLQHIPLHIQSTKCYKQSAKRKGSDRVDDPWNCLVHFQAHAIIDLVVPESDVVLVDCVPGRRDGLRG